jgi:hypothetical protein
LKIALYHTLGKLPEPQCHNRFSWRAVNSNRKKNNWAIVYVIYASYKNTFDLNRTVMIEYILSSVITWSSSQSLEILSVLL